MPNLKDIKRRMGSVKNTQKITHAMKLVSAAKFARANQAVISARPYGKALDAMTNRVVQLSGDSVESPLLAKGKAEKKILLVVIASDRGLCGSLNSNLLKVALRFVKERVTTGASVDIMTWGRRAILMGKKFGQKNLGSREKVLDRPSYNNAKKAADDIVDIFLRDSYDAVYLGFVEFKSAMSQTPKVARLLPVGIEEGKKTDAVSSAHVSPAGDLGLEAAKAPNQALLLEPDAAELVAGLLKRQIASFLFRAFLEGAASEQGARMTAMDSATKNAKEVVRKLTLQYNRGRQAAITKELIEITSGADAL